MSKKRIAGIGATLAVVLALIIGSGENKTVLLDSELRGTFGIVTVSGSGNASDWLEIDASQARMKQLKLTGNYIHVTGGDVSGGASHGVLITGKHILVEGMKVHHGVTENGTTRCSGSGGWGSAIKAQVGAEDVIIRNNDVYENCGEGIGITRGVRVTVEDNRVWDNFSVNIYLDNSPNSQAVRNSTSCSNPNYYRNGAPARGVMLGMEYYAGWGNQMHDVLVDGNTIKSCGGVRLYVDAEMGSSVIRNVAITNNVFYNVPSPLVRVDGAVVANNIAGIPVPVTATPRPPTLPAPATRTVVPVSTATATALPICFEDTVVKVCYWLK